MVFLATPMCETTRPFGVVGVIVTPVIFPLALFPVADCALSKGEDAAPLTSYVLNTSPLQAPELPVMVARQPFPHLWRMGSMCKGKQTSPFMVLASFNNFGVQVSTCTIVAALR